MKRKVPNSVIVYPIRALRDLPDKERRYLLKQMQNYLYNCEFEDRQLRSLKEKVNT